MIDNIEKHRDEELQALFDVKKDRLKTVSDEMLSLESDLIDIAAELMRRGIASARAAVG